MAKAAKAKKLIPVTILTGFLGAGKTTLLNRILNEPHGQRIAVIENEFGPVGVDNDLLIRDGDERIVEMNNGCVCCSVRGDLARILSELRVKRETGRLRFDRVIIETTGVANPGPVCQTFFVDPVVGRYYHLDAVITVVDAVHAMATLDAQPEAQRQVGFADRLLISKTDLVSPIEHEALRSRLMRMNPRAPIQAVHFGECPLAQILDIRGFDIDTALALDPTFLADAPPASEAAHDTDELQAHAEPRASAEPVSAEHHSADSHSSTHAHHADHDGHAHHHHGHVHGDSVAAFVFRARRPFDAARLDAFLAHIVQAHGPDLLRYKGILWLDGINRRVVFQGVHMLMGSQPGETWETDAMRESKLVFIGKELPKHVILGGLAQCLL